MRVERLSGIEQVDTAAWRALELPDFPFFDFEFLRALERSGSIGGASGWSPVYLVCEGRGHLLGALPLYLKMDSYGEYIFDWGWARLTGSTGFRTTRSSWPPYRSHPLRVRNYSCGPMLKTTRR